MRSVIAIAVTLAATLAGARSLDAQSPAAPHAAAYRIADAPAEMQPAAARAQKAFAEFESRMESRLNEEMMRGGPQAALAVYRDEAVAITADLGRRYSGRLGRTSHKLRNPKNAPPAWAAPFVTAAAARSAKDSPTWVVPIGTNVGVIAPLETKDVCLICHGAAASLAPALAGSIHATYPGDRATGFEPGQVRGWLWAEIPRR